MDEPERALFRAHPWVRTAVVRDAGHAVLAKGGRAIIQACRHLLKDFATPSGVQAAPSRNEPAERALVRRIPLTARRVLYVGDASAAVEAELRSGHACVDLQAVPVGSLPAKAAAFDCVAVSDLRPGDVPGLAALLQDGGDLVAALSAMAPEAVTALRTELAQAGLRAMAVHDPKLDHLLNDARGDLLAVFEANVVSQPVVLAARKTPRPPQRMLVQLAAYAPFGMDIRTRLPLEGMRSRPDVAVALCGAPAMLLPAPAHRPKVLILQRPTRTGFELWRRELADAVRRDWITVMEFDDHPDLMARMGGGQTDWRLFSFTHAVQTSTPPLEEAFRPWNPEVKVFENAVFDLGPFADRRPPHRIFYGGLRRGPFAMQVAASMRRVAEAFPQVQFVVVGDRAIFDALPGGRNEFHDLLPYERYLEVMSSCSISLSPIEDAPLLATKSDGKFLDASSRGLLTIASPTVYDRTIRHGETGLIAERLEDWAELTIEALRDESARDRIARAAWSYVREQRMFAHQLPDRIEWYRSLWERRAELTAGLVARVPRLGAELSV
ncbi:glycosyltransferase [Phenylobacterium sp. J426]|uniref:glycosyltransferase family protein n=1 Tax=Phenylobacterium sp. J426 TaxID=2898439 RepID=UPI0021518689|nr:glycosyltransferase [Phenylobacterium sp. J426]MCR5874792.1 glycosyltransferase [Phenylobacterium sp. J426]